MSFFTRNFSTRQLYILGVVVPLACTAAVGFLQWHSVADMVSTRGLARQSREIQLSLASFRAALSDAESCQFRYIVTHNDINLAPYSEFLKQADAQFTALTELTKGNPTQEDMLGQITPLYAQKRRSMEQAMELEKSGDHGGALQVLTAEQGGEHMLALEGVIDKMQDVQSNILAKWQNIYQHNFKEAAILSVVGVALCLLFIAVILFLLRSLARMQSAVMLKALTEMIEYEGGSITIEEYLKRRHEALATHGQAQVEAERLLGLLEQRKLRHSER